MNGDMSITTKRIRKLIDDSGLDRNALADELGCDVSTIAKHYNGKREVNASFIKKYANCFHVSADFLLGLEDNPKDKEMISIICDYTGLSEKAIKNLHDYKTGFSFIDFLERWNDLSLQDGFTGKNIIDTENASSGFDRVNVINSFFGDTQSIDNDKVFYEQFVQAVHDYHIALKSSIVLMKEYLPVLKERIQQLKEDSKMVYLLPDDEKAIVINKLDMPMRYSRYDLQYLVNIFIDDYFAKEIAEFKKISAEYDPLYNEMIELQRKNGKGEKHGDDQETE